MKTRRDKFKVTDGELQHVFEGTNFGIMTHDSEWQRKRVACALLKRLEGYACGYTMTCILMELNLINKKGSVLRRGRNYIFLSFYNRKYS